MTRSMTAAVSTELQASTLRPRILVHFAFDSGAVRVWDGIGDLVFDGDTFSGIGNLGSVGVVKETASLRANGMRFTLSGIPSSLLSIAIGEHYQGRTVEMWRAFLDESHVLIDDPVKIFAGRMDQMVVVDAGVTAEITIAAESRLVELQRPLQTRFYTDQDQQTEFPGDLGFEFVPKMQNKDIIWGRVKLTANPGTSPGDEGGSSEPSIVTPASDIPDVGLGGEGTNVNDPADPVEVFPGLSPNTTLT